MGVLFHIVHYTHPSWNNKFYDDPLSTKKILLVVLVSSLVLYIIPKEIKNIELQKRITEELLQISLFFSHFIVFFLACSFIILYILTLFIS